MIGMLDTGADVTVIAHSKWPSDWELEPISGLIPGIGAVATSWQSKRNIIIKGPEGKVATMKPFVIRAPVTLWGKDELLQWGASLSISYWDF